MRDSIQDEPVSQELRVHVLVTEVLPKIDVAFGEYGSGRVVAYPDTACRSSGYMDERRACSETEVHATLRAADIHILDVRALGEMFHVRGTVEDGGYFYHLGIQALVYIGSDIAVDDEESGAEKVVETPAEIVEEQVAYPALGVMLILSADETGDRLGVGVDEFTQDMDTQESRGTREEDMP